MGLPDEPERDAQADGTGRSAELATCQSTVMDGGESAPGQTDEKPTETWPSRGILNGLSELRERPFINRRRSYDSQGMGHGSRCNVHTGNDAGIVLA